MQKSQYGLVYSSLAQLVVNVRNKKITGYYQTYLTDLSSVRELQATISPLRAVTNLYTTRELADNSRVMQVKLGYTKIDRGPGQRDFRPDLAGLDRKQEQQEQLLEAGQRLQRPAFAKQYIGRLRAGRKKFAIRGIIERISGQLQPC